MDQPWMNVSDMNETSSGVRAEPYAEHDPLDVLVLVTVAYVIIFVAGVVGNVSTCVVIARNRSMHTATNYYLFSLAISDLLLLVCGLPPDAYRVWHPAIYPLGEAACIALGLSSEISANATVLTITAFTVERYIAICHPFLSHTMSKLSRVIRYIVAIWAVALCTAIPQAMQFGIMVTQDQGQEYVTCTVKRKGAQHAFIISSFLFFVGPMTMITVLYALIGVKLRTSRVLHPVKKLSIESNGRTAGGSTRYRNGASQRRVIRMLVAVALSFFVCWAPFHAQRLMAVYGAHIKKPSEQFVQVTTWSDVLMLVVTDLTWLGHLNGTTKMTCYSIIIEVYQVMTYVSGVMYFLSTAINPFLYSIMSNKFREAFRMTLAAWCGVRPPPGLTRNYSALATPHRPGRVSQPFLAGAAGSSRPPRLRRQSTASTQLTAIPANSKAENALLNRSGKRALSAVNESPSGSSWGVARRLRLALAGSRAVNSESAESARSISNSSLRDVDDDEYTGEELATYMQQVNHHIDGSRVCVI